MVEVLEDEVPEMEVNLSDGVLNVQLGEHGHWVINKQTPNEQIWWSSPLSGPKRFEYDADRARWLSTRDGKDLLELLREEVDATLGVHLEEPN